MRKWIKEHRAEIDAHIRSIVPNIGRLNDDERRMWIDNDEYLYRLYTGRRRP